MSGNIWVPVGVLALALVASSCGSDSRLESIQVLPVNPAILSNNTVYATPGSSVQFQIQAWYTGRTVSTVIPNSQGHWSSTQPLVATVDSNGLATSVGPLGVTTIVVTVSGQRSTTVLSVCNVLCPP
jgi:hypothetical protein